MSMDAAPGPLFQHGTTSPQTRRAAQPVKNKENDFNNVKDGSSLATPKDWRMRIGTSYVLSIAYIYIYTLYKDYIVDVC